MADVKYFVVDSEAIDSLAMQFLQLRQTAESIYAKSGACPQFLDKARKMSVAYMHFFHAIGLEQGYGKTAGGKSIRLIRIERCNAKTMITLPFPLNPKHEGLQSIDECQYQELRERALHAIGIDAKAMAAKPIKVQEV